MIGTSHQFSDENKPLSETHLIDTISFILLSIETTN